MFTGGLDATLAARILPLANVLKKFNVECNIIPPIDWQSFVKGKLGNILSVAFTHHFSRYVDVCSDSSDVVIIGRTSTPQMYLLQKLLKSKKTKIIFDLNDALFLPTSRLFGVNIRSKVVSYLGDLKIKQMFRTLEKVVEIDYGLDHWVPLAKYSKLMSDFDIMVAPLQKTLWYEGKSALRVGAGMAMGIPVVASPVGEQKYVIKHGVNGFLAKHEEEWYQYLKLLIEDGKLRREIGRKGREIAEKELSLHICGKKLYDIVKALTE